MLKINESAKESVINILLMSGIAMWIKISWDALEEIFDNGVQESISDTVIAAMLMLIIWNKVRKWFTIKESEVEQ